MQPSDSQPPQKEEKVSFWAKLFGKKPKTPVVPPHESQTPPPQLGNDEAVVPSATVDVPPVNTDNVGGDTSGPSVPDISTQVPPVNSGEPSVPSSDEQKPL